MLALARQGTPQGLDLSTMETCSNNCDNIWTSAPPPLAALLRMQVCHVLPPVTLSLLESALILTVCVIACARLCIHECMHAQVHACMRA